MDTVIPGFQLLQHANVNIKIDVSSEIEVEHFNPNIIDITVYVAHKNNEMRKCVAQLSDILSGRGIPADGIMRLLHRCTA